MAIQFPDPRQADEHGIVYIGGELTEENLVSAYSRGIFPWPHENLPMLWFSPEARGILDFDFFHIPRSVQKELRKAQFEITFDRDFEAVIRACAVKKRKGQRGSWITDEMIKSYVGLHQKGIAHSVECWKEGRLVGGLYGIYLKGIFSGESMFYQEPSASKACLIAMVEKLKAMGHTWFDIQMVTPILDLFGGVYIPREDYLRRLAVGQANNLPWR